MSDAAPLVRCAIYTRKSSEEGLDQAFNSLHAQREACEAYIKSQAGEGWRRLTDAYDDGGQSGGSIDRPALRRLLADVSAHRIDAVVVYKVDRLTRSLSDFAALMETFDRAGVSFVSVTQSFNTSTSMGRLTLNVLLSFAQFERELTGERIRDKIAASKAKGMWMGGAIPLGYDAPSDQRTRALVVNPVEAETVRLIFDRFLELGTSLALQRWLNVNDVRSKAWVTARGRAVGGFAFSRGALFHLLKNRTYLGEIVHKDKSYPGRHLGIVDLPTFEDAQALIAKNRRRRRNHVTRAQACLLNGLVFDGDGQPMAPAFGRTRRRRYQYYASRPPPGAVGDDGREDAIRRVPCSAVDELVIGRASQMLGSLDEASVRVRIRALIGRVEIHSASVHLVVRIKALPAPTNARLAMQQIRDRLAPGEQALSDPSNAGLIRILLPIRLVVRGGRSWATRQDGRPATIGIAPDATLISQLRRSHAVLKECGLGLEGHDRADMLNARAPRSAQKVKLAKMTFLAPEIQRAILAGEQARSPELAQLLAGAMPLSWSKQIQCLGHAVADAAAR